MAYSLVGILAIVIHLIVNFDVFMDVKKKGKFAGEGFYLLFLLSVIIYHITDGFWGLLYENQLADAVIIDTSVYFFAMATSILLWGLFVYFYLGAKNKAITYVGGVVFIFQITCVIINFFNPILFEVSSECVYQAKPLRYAMLITQVAMFLILAIFTFVSSLKSNGQLKRHNLIITAFCLFMMVAIILQTFFPLYPMYSLGYLFGICALHAFVVEDEKRNQKHELDEAKHRISKDPLTGALSKYAYIDKEAEVDERIYNKEMEDFAMVVFDLNDLKVINDTKGHEAGDNYIINSVKLINKCFPDCPLYRVGGDEFASFLTGENYENREKLVNSFNQKIDENVKKGESLVIAAGLSIYIPDKDGTILQTFTRADREMYNRKHQLKERREKGL